LKKDNIQSRLDTPVWFELLQQYSYHEICVYMELMPLVPYSILVHGKSGKRDRLAGWLYRFFHYYVILPFSCLLIYVFLLSAQSKPKKIFNNWISLYLYFSLSSTHSLPKCSSPDKGLFSSSTVSANELLWISIRTTQIAGQCPKPSWTLYFRHT